MDAIKQKGKRDFKHLSNLKGQSCRKKDLRSLIERDNVNRITHCVYLFFKKLNQPFLAK